jgi:hypothetical protein
MFVERVVRDYPTKVEELARLEDTIIACCHMPIIPSTSSSGNAESTEPERVAIAKEQNIHYQRLLRYVAVVRMGLKRLTPQEVEIVDLSCWQRLTGREIAALLHTEERNFWRIRSRAFQKMVQVFITPAVTCSEGR